MTLRSRKRKLIVFLLTFVVLSYVVYQWRYIRNTDEVPYSNLDDFGSGGCMVYVNIEYNDVVYPVIQTNTFVIERISAKNKFVRMHLYPLYLKEVIKHNWSIEVDKEIFTEFSYSIVDKSLIALYNKIDFRTDTTLIVDGQIVERLSAERNKAILYVLLKQGINCCQDDESGNVFISLPE